VDVVFVIRVVGVEAQTLNGKITIQIGYYRCRRINILNTLQILKILLQIGDVVLLLLLSHSFEDAFDVEAST